jgi:amidase
MEKEQSTVMVKSLISEPDFSIAELSIVELQDALEKGTITSESLVQKYLHRIEKYDKAGPAINSLVYINKEAIETARELDLERKEKGTRSLLHGIPIIIKDNYDTIDMPTTASSLVLKDSVPLEDSTMVKQLREAGAVIIAKSNLHEFALGISTESSLGGQTLNPYKLEHNPGGSSGGTAAAIAANFAAVGLGTDTGCSIRNPAAHNNLFGLRPSYGLTSRAGIVPISFTQDTGGPMGKTVTDIAIVMDAISGFFDPRDKSTILGEGKQPESYLDYLNADKLKEAKVGVLVDRFDEKSESAPVNSVIYKAIKQMEKFGAEIVKISIPELKDFDSLGIPYYEFKAAIEDYFDSLGDKRKLSSLKEVIDSGICSDCIADDLKKCQDLSVDDPQYQKALKERSAFQELLIRKMDEFACDAILYPTFKTPAPKIGEQKWQDNNGDISAYSGLPALSIPAGFTEDGIPVGMELIARPFAEPTLIEIAFAFEQNTFYRKMPLSTP